MSHSEIQDLGGVERDIWGVDVLKIRNMSMSSISTPYRTSMIPLMYKSYKSLILENLRGGSKGWIFEIIWDIQKCLSFWARTDARNVWQMEILWHCQESSIVRAKRDCDPDVGPSENCPTKPHPWDFWLKNLGKALDLYGFVIFEATPNRLWIGTSFGFRSHSAL